MGALLKDFGAFVEEVSQQIKQYGYGIAEAHPCRWIRRKTTVLFLIVFRSLAKLLLNSVFTDSFAES